jgi:hypothetical protein
MGERQQHRVGARRHQVADQGGLGGGEDQFLGQRRQAHAAVRVGLGREPVAQQGKLGIAPRREDQPFQ